MTSSCFCEPDASLIKLVLILKLHQAHKHYDEPGLLNLHFVMTVKEDKRANVRFQNIVGTVWEWVGRIPILISIKTPLWTASFIIPDGYSKYFFGSQKLYTVLLSFSIVHRQLISKTCKFHDNNNPFFTKNRVCLVSPWSTSNHGEYIIRSSSCPLKSTSKYYIHLWKIKIFIIIKLLYWLYCKTLKCNHKYTFNIFVQLYADILAYILMIY